LPSFNSIPSIHFHTSFLQFHYLGPQSDFGPNTGITKFCIPALLVPLPR
jgi:hypothetical protein